LIEALRQHAEATAPPGHRPQPAARADPPRPWTVTRVRAAGYPGRHACLARSAAVAGNEGGLRYGRVNQAVMHGRFWSPRTSRARAAVRRSRWSRTTSRSRSGRT